MFSSEHEIWKFASLAGELNDWLPYAEDLVNKWAGQSSDEIRFGSTFEVILAAYLLMDDLLPPSAKKAFGRLILDTISEAGNKKFTLKRSGIGPRRPGRKVDKQSNFLRMREVIELIEGGHKKDEAYKLVANKHHKAPVTIRRDYERRVLPLLKRKKNGEIDK